MPSDLTTPAPVASVSQPASAPAAPGWPDETKTLAILAVAIGLCFIVPLSKLVLFAVNSSLYSHILLIPFISAYLLRLQGKQLGVPAASSPRPDRLLAIVPILLGVGLLIGYRVGLDSGWKPAADDSLSLHAAAALSLFYAGCLLLIDIPSLRRVAFPLALLIFAIPFPDRVYHAIESFLQYRSADAAYLLFNLTGMPVWRNETDFKLPGFSLGVAPECSGIHSSLVLFISSLLAAHMLLRSNWSRIVFVAVVIPLGILRNGFRIWVLGELCVQLSHDWINSELHHRGGPIFFVLSLVPLFALLFLLRRLEKKKVRPLTPDC
jgi:exosortase C (VPDSG-CTERM-specific)